MGLCRFDHGKKDLTHPGWKLCLLIAFDLLGCFYLALRIRTLPITQMALERGFQARSEAWLTAWSVVVQKPTRRLDFIGFGVGKEGKSSVRRRWE
jgi:hypothetical protein